MSFVVRVLNRDDLTVADEIVRAAYAMRPGQNTGLERYLSLQPDGWLLIEVDGAPVALGGAMSYGSFGYIGLMSVLPAMQHRGIGRLIMERLLAWCRNRDCRTILLDASAAGAPLYSSMGFSVDDTVIEWGRSGEREALGSHQLPSHSTGHITAMIETDIADLVVFDTPYFGAPRPSVFASYLADCRQAFVARDETGGIAGYLFVQAGGRLGPWVAATSGDAERLLEHALQLPTMSGEYTVQCPSANSEGQNLLLRYGFHQRRVLQHMRLGDPVQPRDRTNIYGQASFGLG